MSRMFTLLSCVVAMTASAQPVPITMPGAAGVLIITAPPVVDPLPPPRIDTTPPAPQAPRPATLAACDPGGCWDSEGRRLNQVGPVLAGPRGACTVQGGMVQCP